MKSPRAAVLLLVLAVAGTLVAGTLVAAPASAHAQWLGSDPEEGVVLTELPATVVMTYSEEIAPQFVDTAVVPPGGEPRPTEAVADGVDVTIDLAGALPDVLPAGQWQVVARVVSADGHPVEHTTTFALEGAPVAAPAPTPDLPVAPGPSPAAPSEPASPSTQPTTVTGEPVAAAVDGLPGWALALLGLGAVGAAAAALVVQLRRRPPQA